MALLLCHNAGAEKSQQPYPVAGHSRFCQSREAEPPPHQVPIAYYREGDSVNYQRLLSALLT